MTVTHVKEIEKVQIRYLRRIISIGTDVINYSFVISIFFQRDEKNGHDKYQILYLKQYCKNNENRCIPYFKIKYWKIHGFENPLNNDCLNPFKSDFFSHPKSVFINNQSYSAEPEFDKFHCIIDGEERIILNESEETNINIWFDICQIPIKDKYERHEKIGKFILGKISEHIQSLPHKKNYFIDDQGNKYYDFENIKLFNVGFYFQNHQNSDMFIS